MARYMLTADFRSLSVMPSPDVDLIEQLEPNWLQAQIDLIGGWIDSRLAKRYAVPFGGVVGAGGARTDVPAIVKEWVAAILTPRAYAKRGVNPTSGELWFVEMVVEPAKRALADVQEAAKANEGLFDLPLLGSTDPAGAASRSGPKGYTEASPYVWFDKQREIASDEDEQGGGTVS